MKGKTMATNISGGKGFGGGKGYKDGGFGGGKGYKDGGKGFDRFDDGKGKSKGKGKGKPQANTVFVGGLSWDTTTETLRATFEECGDIIYAGVMTDRNTGRSRGSGKVEFADQDAMDNAIRNLNGRELDGRTISVREFS